MGAIINNPNARQGSKVAKIAVKVPLHKPGNVIEHLDVDFDVYQDGEYFTALPLQNRKTARLTGLPSSFSFSVKDNWVRCSRAEFKYVAVDIFTELKKLGKV